MTRISKFLNETDDIGGPIGQPTEQTLHSFACFEKARDQFMHIDFRIRDSLVIHAVEGGYRFVSYDSGIQTRYWVHRLNGMNHGDAVACASTFPYAVPGVPKP
jgi:hypothetical protein